MSYGPGLSIMFSIAFVAGFVWYSFESDEATLRHCIVAGVICGVVATGVIFALDTWFPVGAV